MNATELIERARAEGVNLLVAGDRVTARGQQPAIERWLPILRAHRDELRAWLDAERLIRAAMRACDYWGDDTVARQQMVRDCLGTPTEQRGALQAHFERAYPLPAEPRDLPAPDTSGGNQG